MRAFAAACDDGAQTPKRTENVARVAAYLSTAPSAAPPEQPRREQDTEILVGLPPNRIEALADGIFAVAMTILVLELRVPDSGSAPTEARVVAALVGFAPKILSFVSGFVILGTLWIGPRAR